ncbi:MAG TPA: hypothetical protein PK771_15725, partial [Spirochaetota bacterium]|nr:hypothetical protein [Spirochaetota bacterium]
TSMEKIFKEQNLSYSEEFNQSKAVQLGEMLGANVVIIGKVSLLNDIYNITVKGVDVEKGTIKFSENIQTKSLKTIGLTAKEIGYSVSFYGENTYKAFDINFGCSFTISNPTKLSKRLERFFIWPLWPNIGVLSFPVSFTFYPNNKISIGMTFSHGIFARFVPVIIPYTMDELGYAMFTGAINLKLLFRLKAEQPKKSYKFIFEAGVFTDLNLLYAPTRAGAFSKYYYGVDMGPVFSFGVENRRNQNFFLEYSGFIGTTFDMVPFEVYTTGREGFSMNVILGMEIRFGYYNLFPKQEKRLGVL